MSRVHNALRRADSPNPDDPQKQQEVITSQPETLVATNEPHVEQAPSAAPQIDKPVIEEEPAAEVTAVPTSQRIAQALKKAALSDGEAPVASPDSTPLQSQSPPADIPAPAYHPPPPVSYPPQVLAEEPAPAPEVRFVPEELQGEAAPATPERRYTQFPGLFGRIEQIPFNPSPDASLLDPNRPAEGPIEEFRGLRTRLNHLQGIQKLRSIIVTSPSPAEGKSFTAANLAIAQSQLDQNPTLLVDFDFRRPSLHNLLQIDRSPGLTDYLQGKVNLEDVIKQVGDSGLYVIPAGEAVINPLELLNLPEVKRLLDYLSGLFRWVIADTPPLLFAADANLLSTMSDGTILVVRIGSTTIDSVTRAIQSLCQNNILGIVVNGAHRGELYSKFTYYHSYYYSKSE